MAVTVVCGRQQATVVERAEGAGDGIEPDICNIGRGSPQHPVDVRLSDHVSLSRRSAQVRCIDGSWWQIRQVGANGLTLKTERGVIMPLTADWCDVPARFGVAYVTVTTLAETFEFKVTPNLADIAPDGPTAVDDAAVGHVNVATRIIPK